MSRYGVTVDQLSAHVSAAAFAAERTGARTLIYRDQVSIAAIVPMADYDRLDPPDPAEAGGDPLLELCGNCREDHFVDSLRGDFNSTWLFKRS